MRAVIFDIGSVLIGWKPELMYRKLIPDSILRTYFLAEVSRAPWEEELVRAGAFEEGLRRLAERSPIRAKTLAGVYDRMVRDMLDNRMKATATLMERLSAQGVGLFGATSLKPTVLAQVEQYYPATLGQLAGVVIEAEAGVPQSDPGLFEYALRRFGLRADACLYVDESEQNTRAADSAGMAVHCYTWITPLRRELRARGFLPVPPVLRP